MGAYIAERNIEKRTCEEVHDKCPELTRNYRPVPEASQHRPQGCIKQLSWPALVRPCVISPEFTRYTLADFLTPPKS